jgi:DNA-binding transcriptional MocR family regulator
MCACVRVVQLLESGFLPRHVQRLVSVLGSNLDAMCESIDAHIPGAAYTKPRGG